MKTNILMEEHAPIISQEEQIKYLKLAQQNEQRSSRNTNQKQYQANNTCRKAKRQNFGYNFTAKT